MTIGIREEITKKDEEDKEQKERERIAPSRKYSVLEDERKPYLENGQQIETF